MLFINVCHYFHQSTTNFKWLTHACMRQPVHITTGKKRFAVYTLNVPKQMDCVCILSVFFTLLWCSSLQVTVSVHLRQGAHSECICAQTITPHELEMFQQELPQLSVTSQTQLYCNQTMFGSLFPGCPFPHLSFFSSSQDDEERSYPNSHLRIRWTIKPKLFFC